MSAKPLRPLIWVPGEPSEHGLVVTDAVSEQHFVAPEKGERVDLPPRHGRPARTVTALRCELVRVETKRGKPLAVVLVAGMEVRVRVLAKWQLEGARDGARQEVRAPAPEPETAGALAE
ncbi:MAG TPA: hypothetical protein VGE74_30895 [Gemmata sp.]